MSAHSRARRVGPCLDRTSSRGARFGEDAGSATPFTLMLGLAFIVLPVMVLVLSLPTWEERTVDAQDAARGAAQALVAASTWAQGQAAAAQALAEIIVGDGLPEADMSARYAGSLQPGGSVSVSVTILVPVGVIPGLGSIGALHYTATSVQPVGTYRDSAT